MAQDFGDDMGNALLNFVTRQTENYLRFGRGRERAFDWWQRHYKKEGNTPEQAKAMAEKQSSREQVVVPFGTSEEAAYYAQVCRENGTYAAAYTDKQGNGFLAFAKEDAKTVAGYAPQFKDVMARLDEQRITDALNRAEPVNKKTMDSLTELTSYPDLPAEDVTVIPVTIRYKDAPEETYDVLFSEQDTENLNIDDSICFSGYSHKELTEMVGRETHEDFDVISVGAPYKVHATQVKTDAPEKTYDVPGKDAPARSDRVATLRAEDTAIHTQNIRNAAQKAREDCTDFSDFERKMNAQGFGVTETSKGEVMAYEPASLNKDGSVPAYERGRDWPVSAETLKNRYDLDVTHNWFEQNTPKDAGTLPDGDLAMQNARLAQEQMDYTFNSNDVIDRLSGETKNLVVFEVMFKGSIENASDETPVSIVASECDKDNEGQTVKLAPSTIGTTATDKSDGDHELMAGKDAVITDEVKYEGLIPGKEYTLHATLMDKKTGEPLKVADKGVTAELKFTPNSESGTVSINLGEFDATSLDGHTLVVFEELTKQSDIDGKATDVTVAEHKDINDEGQSVTVTSTPAGSTYGKTGVDMTNIAIAIGILLIAAGCATAYGIKSRKTTKGDADENAEDNTEA